MSVADGYGIVLINEVGNKALTKELNAFDLHLTNYFGEGDCFEFFANCVLEYRSETDVKDCLVMVKFRYVTYQSSTLDGIEYDEDFIIEEVHLLKAGYKEFWRDQLSMELTQDGHQFGTVDELIKEDEQDEQDEVHKVFGHYEQDLEEEVESWELLYDEALVLSERYQSKENYKNHQLSIQLKNFGFAFEK